ncbi:recombinase family protein [bacterium]|nr:recombinase family protein [bacterium]
MQTSKDLYDALVAFHRPDEADKVDIKTLRFVLYARKSTTSDERQERAISDQKKDCLDTAKRLEIPYENITIVEEQESAKEPDIRVHFKQMIEDIKRGKYDAILTWHPDRLARNMEDLHRLVRQITDKGCTLRFVKENLTFTNDQTDAARKLAEQINWDRLKPEERDLVRTLRSPK